MYVMIPISQENWTIVDGIDGDLSDLSWCTHNGYAIRAGVPFRKRANDSGRMYHRLLPLHRVVMERKVRRPLLRLELVDHIDGNKLDNRRENLRIVNNTQNVRNRSIQKNNACGYKGVSWSKNRRRWVANIMYNKQAIFLGTFDTPENAARAYNQAALKYHGEHARLNVLPKVPPNIGLWD